MPAGFVPHLQPPPVDDPQKGIASLPHTSHLFVSVSDIQHNYRRHNFLLSILETDIPNIQTIKWGVQFSFICPYPRISLPCHSTIISTCSNGILSSHLRSSLHSFTSAYTSIVFRMSNFSFINNICTYPDYILRVISASFIPGKCKWKQLLP